MQVFYSSEHIGDTCRLNGEESKHCVQVLRMKPGQEVHLTDGQGGWYLAEIGIADPKACVLKILKKYEDYGTRPARLHLAIAPTKSSDRFEWLLEKATECGIDEITPVICEKSERTIVKPERLLKVIVSAMKQSQRAWMPVLHPAVKLKSFFEMHSQAAKYLAHCHEGEKTFFKDSYAPGQDALVLIGPEGDFSLQETALAIEKGYRAISLGAHRLRTETAALAICVQFNTLNGML